MKKLLIMTLWATVALAQSTQMAQPTATTQPATSPTTKPAAVDAEGTLDRLLRARPGTATPIQPVSPQEANAAAQPRDDVAPRTPAVPPKREGDMIVQRVGRLHSEKAGEWQFRFESDRKQLHDPPMTILPNRRLAEMEDALKRAGGDLRFQVTGMVTQYRGKNYLLIEKAAEVVTDHEGL